jgi:hypothetical protein
MVPVLKEIIHRTIDERPGPHTTSLPSKDKPRVSHCGSWSPTRAYSRDAGALFRGVAYRAKSASLGVEPGVPGTDEQWVRL